MPAVDWKLDINGCLLGTNNKGLQGRAIVMDEKNFKQGMDHESAMKHNLGYGGLDDYGARNNFIKSYNSLSSRPDYDGRLTLNEANEWYRKGNGQPLFVDASKINLASQYRDNFQVGEAKYINYASPSNTYIKSGLVYGTIQLTMLDFNGTTKLGGFDGKLDTYDFDYQKERVGRNIATWIGSKVAGEGVSYDFSNYGTSTLRNRLITPTEKPFWSVHPKY